MKKLLIGSLFVGGLLAVILKMFEKTVVAKKDSASDSFDEVDTYVERHMMRLRIPGASLAIVEDDEIVHQRGFGHDSGRHHPSDGTPSPQTPFLIGSLTKSFTALAVMQLVEADKINLDAPIQHYLPWFRVADPRASAQITVRHLLNQISGLSTSSGWIPLSDFDDSLGAPERQARMLSTLELSHPVGSAFEYSNSNYNLLGLIIEATSGELYADYIQNHIFNPLDMSHSYTSQAVAKKNGLATGHQYWFWFPVAVPDLPIPHGSLPSGQLISSAEDMGHYMIALLNGGHYGNAQILSDASIAEMQRGVVEDIEMGMSMGKYGMGWYISEIDQTQLVWHTGMVPDFSSYMALIPEQKKGVVLLINTDHFMMNPVLAEVGRGVASLLAGEEPAPIRFGFMPWAMRSLLLIPFFQIIGVAVTLRSLRRWHQDPMSRPTDVRKRGVYVLLPMILNLLVALTMIPVLGPMRGFWKLFMPDFSWIAMISGGFAAIWVFLRTGLVLRALRKPPASKSSIQSGTPPN